MPKNCNLHFLLVGFIMNILISNDDGIDAEGIRILAKTLAKAHNVTVVAPKNEMSASSHAITIHTTVSLKEVPFEDGIKAYSLSGTPADCVKFALSYFDSQNFDVVVAGINRGSNTGTDVLYSGTVSCAAEAVALNYKGIAVSCVGRTNSKYKEAADFILKNLEEFCSLDLKNTILNINIPKDEIIGSVYTKLGLMLYNDKYHLIEDGQEKVFRLLGEVIDHDGNDEDCDVEYVKKGFITVTPILCSYTNFEVLKDLKENGKLR